MSKIRKPSRFAACPLALIISISISSGAFCNIPAHAWVSGGTKGGVDLRPTPFLRSNFYGLRWGMSAGYPVLCGCLHNISLRYSFKFWPIKVMSFILSSTSFVSHFEKVSELGFLTKLKQTNNFLKLVLSKQWLPHPKFKISTYLVRWSWFVLCDEPEIHLITN